MYKKQSHKLLHSSRTGNCIMLNAETIFQSRRWIYPVHYPGLDIIFVIKSSVLWWLTDLCRKLWQWLYPLVSVQIVKKCIRISRGSFRSQHPVCCTLKFVVAQYLCNQYPSHIAIIEIKC